jgi:hypothetical protein
VVGSGGCGRPQFHGVVADGDEVCNDRVEAGLGFNGRIGTESGLRFALLEGSESDLGELGLEKEVWGLLFLC